jgi:NtrC-family two-component system response regulator AlgB
VRIIAATNRNLEDAVEEGTFREDLFYRVNVITIEIPPLRERPEDVIDYAEDFLLFFAARYDRPRMAFSEEAREYIRKYPWPGNVRELQNAVERAVILAVGEEVSVDQFPRGSSLGNGGTSLPGVGSQLVSLEEMESRYIQHVLAHTDSIEDAADTLGVAPSTLWRRRRKYGI